MMIQINQNYKNLKESYLFSDVARRIAAFKEANPGVEVIKMSIGDVTQPICAAAIEAMHRAIDEQAHTATFHGYGPEQGYEFLRRAIAEHDYRGIISPDEIFVSDGAKSDIGNIGDILAASCRVAVTDPVYPVYVDTNIMAGRHIEYLPCTEATGFVPPLPREQADMIYLCSPNNPMGTALTRSQLKEWVDYARSHHALILFDSAYEIFITDPDVPHSIYEIEGAKECAIEFRSFSKTAGFTGLRCGYTVVPEALNVGGVSLRKLWLRRQTTKFNGVSYPVQCGAAAVYTPEGRKQILETVAYYLENARLLRQGLGAEGFTCYGGVNAPYIWLKTPGDTDSWAFFDRMLNRCGVACTPGAGFGPSGEGYVRLTSFNTRENTLAAISRLKSLSI